MNISSDTISLGVQVLHCSGETDAVAIPHDAMYGTRFIHLVLGWAVVRSVLHSRRGCHRVLFE